MRITLPLVALLTATLLTGCAGTSSKNTADSAAPAAPLGDGYAVTPGPGRADRALYDALGGQDGIAGVVDATLVHVANDVRINLLFADTDLKYLRARLIEQICEAAGGPCTYTGLSMEEAHSGQDIDENEFRYFVEDLIAGLNDRKVPKATQDQLLTVLASMKDQILHQ